MAAAYAAGASGLPFGVLRGYLGSDLPKYNPNIKFIECPFTGERLAAVPAIRPDVAVIHAQKADRQGNVLLWGVTGVQKEAVLAAEARDRHRRGDRRPARRAAERGRAADSGSSARCAEVQGGAFPSYALGYYPRNNAFYKQWDDDRARARHVHAHGSSGTCAGTQRLRRVPPQPASEARANG